MFLLKLSISSKNIISVEEFMDVYLGVPYTGKEKLTLAKMTIIGLAKNCRQTIWKKRLKSILTKHTKKFV